MIKKYNASCITMVTFTYQAEASQTAKVGLNYGAVVAVNSDGSYIAVSDPDEKVGLMTGAGAVYIYEFDGTTLTEIEKLSGTVQDGYFGCALDFNANGDYLAVGSNGVNSKVEVYEFNGVSNWLLYGTADTGVNNTGYSVSLSPDGTKLAAGYNDIGIGSPGDQWFAGIFEYDGGTAYTFYDAKMSTDDNYGTSLSLRSDLLQLTIGADKAGDFPTDAGKYVTYDIPMGFTGFGVKLSDIPGDGAEDFFGHVTSWAPNEESYVVSAPQGELGISAITDGKGYAKIHRADGSIWGTVEGENKGDNFGWSVSASDATSNFVGVGAPGYTDATDSDPVNAKVNVGAAYMYHYDVTDHGDTETQITVVDLGKIALLSPYANYGRANAMSGDGSTWVVTYGNQFGDGSGTPSAGPVAGGAYVFVIDIDATTTDNQETTAPETTAPPTTPPTTKPPTTPEPPDEDIRKCLKYWNVALNGFC